MKAIMISDKPKWCAKIMNGDKTIEVRKNKRLYKAIQTLISMYGYAEIYVYCSKNGGNLVYGTEYYGGSFVDEYGITRGYSKQQASVIFGGLLNGKVVFKFRCYKVEEFPYVSDEYDKLIGSCLSEKELLDYSTIKFENGVRFVKTIYAIHINDLEIFDEPKELWEFDTTKQNLVDVIGQTQPVLQNIRLTKAPSDYIYIEVL